MARANKQAGTKLIKTHARQKHAQTSMPQNPVAIAKPNNMGRPKTYTDEIGNEILERMAQGRTLTSVCSDKDMPSINTVYTWLDNPKLAHFRQTYQAAKERAAETMVFDTVDIVDDADKETAAVAKLRADTRYRLASILVPQRFNDKYMAASLVSENNRINQINVVFMQPQARPEPVTIEHDPVDGMADTVSAEHDD